MFINVMRFNKKDIVGDFSRAKALSKWLVRSFSCFVVLVGVLFSVEVSAAYSLVYSNVASGYSNCRYSETDTVATFQVRINFNTAYNNIGNAPGFWSRGVLLYTYDENGNINPSSNIASTVTMDNFSYGGVYPGENYAMYYAKNNTYWSKQEPFAAEVKVTVLKSKIASWPAIGVRAGNYTDRADVADVSGLAYIGPSTTGSNCTLLVNPEAPPPAVTPTVTMTAPDWDLGELPRGKETTVALPATKDQLCFSYEGSTAIANQKYLINATNTNGLSANGRYLLKSLEDSSQTVPYTLTLENSKDSVLLPNTQNRLFSLETGGKTCFTPTFKAQPDKAVKGGAYSDILTFTVVAKP